MPFLRRGKLELFYEVHEGLAAQPTLFLHGNLASNVWWEPALEELKSRGKKTAPVVLAEWRGCGRSQVGLTESDLALEEIARDQVALAREFGLGPMAIVGHSTGGLIALLAMQAAPELFARALLLDTVGAKGVKLQPAILEAFQHMSKNRELCAAVMASTIENKNIPSALLNRIVDAAYSVHPAIWEGVPKMLDGIDYSGILAEIRQPTLVLHGELDGILPLADSRALASGLPHARFELLAGRGHSANVEDPSLFVDHLERFLWA